MVTWENAIVLTFIPCGKVGDYNIKMNFSVAIQMNIIVLIPFPGARGQDERI